MASWITTVADLLVSAVDTLALTTPESKSMREHAFVLVREKGTGGATIQVYGSITETTYSSVGNWGLIHTQSVTVPKGKTRMFVVPLARRLAVVASPSNGSSADIRVEVGWFE